MDNVINLEDKRKKKERSTEQLSFEEVAKINQERQKELENQRREQNRLVLVRYRIKTAE